MAKFIKQVSAANGSVLAAAGDCCCPGRCDPGTCLYEGDFDATAASWPDAGHPPNDPFNCFDMPDVPRLIRQGCGPCAPAQWIAGNQCPWFRSRVIGLHFVVVNGLLVPQVTWGEECANIYSKTLTCFYDLSGPWKCCGPNAFIRRATCAARFFPPESETNPDFGSACTGRPLLPGPAQITLHNVDSTRNEVQTISKFPAGSGSVLVGQYRLTFNGQQTSDLNSTDNAATVQAALEGLSTIGSGNVLVSGGPLATGSLTVRFAGSLAPGCRPIITITNGTIPLTCIPPNFCVAGVMRTQKGIHPCE